MEKNRVEPMNTRLSDDSEQTLQPGRPWTVHLFTPEDAPGVTTLFRDVYGEDYPIKAYLDPDRLIRENRAGTIISSVAKTPEGRIVGHNALFNVAPCARVFESGAGLVHKDYRGGHGIFTRLVQHGIQAGPGRFPVESVFGEPVCNHPFSQKMSRTVGFLSRALEINLMPAEAYSREQSAQGRVSTLLEFITLKPRPCVVYVPKAYETQIPVFYEDMDDDRRFELSDPSPPVGSLTRLTVRIFDFAKVARVAIPDLGQDFATVFRAEEKQLLDSGIQVIQAWLPSALPWVGHAVDRLRSMGYFLGGVLPRWFDGDGLLMGKITDPPDWDGMVLEFERAQKLAALVRTDCERAGYNRTDIEPIQCESIAESGKDRS